MSNYVNIVYLPYRRFHYSEVLLKILNDCKFKDFHLTVCGMGHHDGDCESIVNHAKILGINATKLIVTSSWENYIDKLKIVSGYDYEYSIKLDEDIFLNSDTWDFIFNNLHLLNDKDFILAPILSNGIPSCDTFIYRHMDELNKSHLYSIFSKTRIPNIWGADYSSLDNVIRQSGYESDRFYGAVKKLNHYYKGIHPIRISLEAQLFLNEWIMNNFYKFFEKVEYSVEGSGRPYFCNSVFAIRTKEWYNILHNQSLFRDSFDEVPLNLYRDAHDKNILFISNNVGIHTMYNTLYGEMKNSQELVSSKEEAFFKFIKERVCGK